MTYVAMATVIHINKLSIVSYLVITLFKTLTLSNISVADGSRCENFLQKKRN